MKTRIITGIILIPLLVLILISNTTLITLAIIAVSLIGLYEFYKATQLSQKRALCLVGYAAGIVIPLLKSTFNPAWDFSLLWQLLIYVFIFALFIIMLAQHKTVSVTDAAMVIFSVIYIPYFLTHLLLIRHLENGAFLIWLPFLGAFSTDTFAYFTGFFLGKHKLCPEISPKKTIEGAIGGTVGCMVIVLLFGLCMEKFLHADVNYIRFGILGILCAVISQIGDLTASIIKRKFGIKDYGNLFPGHGGILDRLDSVIAIAPLVYIYLALIGI
ncbi:MAG: phosphatidate cytidylyltransferase [Clostridia bacterium]|nr:phosphatidate cytidylyltransferase [Clostridia bacterium]